MKYEHFTLLHPTNPAQNEFVRVDEDLSAQLCADLACGNIHTRAATAQEIESIYEGVGDPEVDATPACFLYPEDRGTIFDLFVEWNTLLSFEEMIHVIANCCYDECRTPDLAYDFLERRYQNRIDAKKARALVDILNFAAVRENATLVFGVTS